MPDFPRSARLCLAALLCTLAVACASVSHTPATLSPAPDAAVRTLRTPATISFDTHYQRKLAAGSQWKLVGTLPQGQVYKPVNDVFTVEGAHMHEAYLVIADGHLVGFYLPAESGFSSLAHQQALNFN